MGTHKTPVSISLHATHEYVGDPESIEQVSGAILFFTCIFLQIQKLEYVAMPWLQIDGKSSRSLKVRDVT